MKDYLNNINDKFPIRKSNKEKQAFYDYVASDLGHDRVKIGQLENNNNIIIGDPSSAKAIFTAHYDTPASSPVPNFMIPANKVLGTLINFCYPLAVAIISLLLGFGVGDLLGFDNNECVLLYLVFYFSIFFFTRLVPNKHNKNDNTSGVATVMSIATKYNNEKVAFILFDNEEKGLLGSKAYNKKYKKMMEDKLLVNLDCVGNGDQIVLIPKEKIIDSEEYKLLSEVFSGDTDGFIVHQIPFKKSLGNSDHKSFPGSVGVMAARKGKVLKLVTGRIHTAKDTMADSKNILFLSTRFGEFIDRL